MYRKKYGNRKKPYTKRYRKTNNRRRPQSVVSAPTKRNRYSAMQIARYRKPIFQSSSKLVKDQLYYDQLISLAGTIGNIATIHFWANNVYDPYAATGGHQAIGFDQMMLLFEHFCVIRSKITVTFISATSNPIRVGIYINPDTTSVVNINTLLENGLISSKVIERATVGGSTVTCTLDLDVKKYFGKKTYRDLLDDEKLTGDGANSPIEGVYYSIFAFDPFTNQAFDVRADVIISYDTIYFEPRKLAAS